MPTARRTLFRPAARLGRGTAAVLAGGALAIAGLTPSPATAVDPAEGIGPAAGARIADGYELTWLTPVPGHTVSSALGINDNGDVVGLSRPTGAAQPQFTVVWDGDDHAPAQLDNLEGSAFSRGFDLADDGLVVGEAFTPEGASVPVSWDGTSPHHITSLNPAGTGVANDVNDAGIAVATAHNGSATRAFAVDLPDDSATELEVPQDATVTRASAIADNGAAAGSAILVETHDDHTHTTTRAATWEPDGNVTVLPSIEEFVHSTARGINSEGVVVGEYQQAGASTAVAWVDGELTPLPPASTPDYPHTTASAVNDDGIVVGSAAKFLGNSSFGGAAVVWDGDGAVNLNDATDVPEGVELRSASDINNAGQIVGSAQTPDGPRGYLLTPTTAPEPLETSLSAIAGPARYGRSTRLDLRVTSTGQTPVGSIEVRVDGRRPSTATLSQGRATLRLSRTLSAGRHTIKVTYAGTERFAPATTTRSLRVTKARAKVALRLSQRVARVREDRLIARVSAGIVGSTLKPRGRVVVKVGNRVVRRFRLSPRDAGARTVVLPRFTTVGTARVRARYIGNHNVRPASSRPVLVRVRRS